MNKAQLLLEPIVRISQTGEIGRVIGVYHEKDTWRVSLDIKRVSYEPEHLEPVPVSDERILAVLAEYGNPEVQYRIEDTGCAIVQIEAGTEFTCPFMHNVQMVLSVRSLARLGQGIPKPNSVSPGLAEGKLFLDDDDVRDIEDALERGYAEVEFAAVSTQIMSILVAQCGLDLNVGYDSMTGPESWEDLLESIWHAAVKQNGIEEDQAWPFFTITHVPMLLVETLEGLGMPDWAPLSLIPAIEGPGLFDGLGDAAEQNADDIGETLAAVGEQPAERPEPEDGGEIESVDDNHAKDIMALINEADDFIAERKAAKVKKPLPDEPNTYPADQAPPKQA